MYIVTQEDLIGKIKDFPIEIVQKMIDSHYERTGVFDIKLLQNCVTGWNIHGTEEGSDFWYKVVHLKNFDLFFERYPKENNEDSGWIEPKGAEMLVWDNNEKKAVKRIVLAKLPKGADYLYVCVGDLSEEYFRNGDDYIISLYKNAKPLPKQTELTMQDIAEKFGLSVDEIKIV